MNKKCELLITQINKTYDNFKSKELDLKYYLFIPKNKTNNTSHFIS